MLKCKKATKTTRSWKMHLIISFFADHSHSSLRRCVHYWTLCFFLSSAKGTWQRIQSKTHGQNWSLPNSGNIHEFLISVKKCKFFFIIIFIFNFQMSDIVLHYTTGQMDRFHSQVKKLKQLDQTVLDPSEPWKPRTEKEEG